MARDLLYAVILTIFIQGLVVTVWELSMLVEWAF